MVGVGILGLGRVSRGHGRTLKDLPGAELVAACDLDKSRVDKFVEEHGCDGETSMDALLKRKDVDVVAVLLPHGLHEEAVRAAAKAGKHVFVEKPLAMDVDAANRMAAACQEAGVQLFAAHTERFISATRAAKQVLDSGQVGTPVMVTDVWYQPFNRHTRQPWMLDRSRGGGFLQMAGSHMIDRLTYLLGSRVRDVRAAVKTAYHPDIKCDDAVMAFLMMENGVPCTLSTVSYKDTENAGVEAHGMEFLCTDGMMKVDKRRNVYVSKGGKYEQVEVKQENGVGVEWNAFLKALDKGGPLPVTFEEARHIVAVMEACEESSEKGESVRVKA